MRLINNQEVEHLFNMRIVYRRLQKKVGVVNGIFIGSGPGGL